MGCRVKELQFRCLRCMQLYTYNFLGLQSENYCSDARDVCHHTPTSIGWGVRESSFRCLRCLLCIHSCLGLWSENYHLDVWPVCHHTPTASLGWSHRITVQMPEMCANIHPLLPWVAVTESPFRCLKCVPIYTHYFLGLESQNHRSDAWNVCQYTPTTSLGCRARELPFRCLRCLLIKALQETYWRNPPAVQAAGLRHIVREVTNGCNAAPCFCCVHPLGLQNDSLMLLTSKLEASSSKQQQKLFHLHSAPVVPSCTPILTTVSNCKTDPKKRQT